MIWIAISLSPPLLVSGICSNIASDFVALPSLRLVARFRIFVLEAGDGF